jgi:hypothetical protein
MGYSFSQRYGRAAGARSIRRGQITGQHSLWRHTHRVLFEGRGSVLTGGRPRLGRWHESDDARRLAMSCPQAVLHIHNATLTRSITVRQNTLPVPQRETASSRHIATAQTPALPGSRI